MAGARWEWLALDPQPGPGRAVAVVVGCGIRVRLRGVCPRRDGAAAREFFVGALRFGPAPTAVTTDRAPVYPRIIDELVPAPRHVSEQYANNVVEADHGRLKARLRPMRGVKRLASARRIAAGHSFVQNLRRGHYAITADVPVFDRVRVAFDDLALTL